MSVFVRFPFRGLSHTFANSFTIRKAISSAFRSIKFRITCGLFGASVYAWYYIHENRLICSQKRSDKKVSWHEQQFYSYCTVNYEGEMYMSPRDFLESVSEVEPRGARVQMVDSKMLQAFAKKTPSLSKKSSHFLRDTWNNGLLSYGDYLFLLTALTKPLRQFEIVFKMIDIDGNDSIDIEEFELMQRTITRQQECLVNKGFRTTLELHLFGKGSGTKVSSRDLFCFIDNIQNEIREMEFNKLSLGGPTITAHQFATIILRNTNFDMDRVFSNLQKNCHSSDYDISFEQFSIFCQLLNSLDDFACAMTMYTIAGMPITEEEFARATKLCTGKILDSHVVHIIFTIFDLDGDGKLSHKEFLSVMKDWKLGGKKVRHTGTNNGMWSQLRVCMKSEMKNQ